MQRSQTTGFYDTFAQRQAVACIYAGSSSDSFLLTGLACVCSVGERERGGTLTPGRAFSLRSDRAESSRGVGPPATEKENPPFFIVKDAVECDGLISKGPGRGISERKGPAKATEGKQKAVPPLSPPTLWSWMRICGWTCPGRVGCSEPYRPHELSPREVVDLPLRFPDPAVELLR